MKKNIAMRLASGLMLSCLLSTCVISGTFAKYTTSSTGSDQARVAKWGFEAPATITMTDLFKTAYDTTVGAATDVIAPGTTSSVSFGFAYDQASNTVAAPEVAYTFVVDASASTCADAIKANSNIVWSLDGVEMQNWEALIAAINALDGNVDGDRYEAGTLPAAFYGSTPDGAKTHTVTWVWKYQTTPEVDEEDEKDTAMGNADVLANVKIVITITATQID